MQAFCPNLNNKNIKAEFEELKEALGEDLAYLAWHRSEGEGLGNHPGQADSEAFKAVLEAQQGNRKEAIKKAARELIIGSVRASKQDAVWSAHHTDKKVSGTKNLLDEIPKEGATPRQIVDNVVDFLKDKFVNLKISVYDNIPDISQQSDEEKRVFAILSSNKNTKSMVYHGRVYIVRSRLEKHGGQIASEEILHMLVKTLQEDNSALFQSLLAEAREKFKKLTKEVESTYKKLGQDTIDNEIVTQALARFVNSDIQRKKHSKFADLVQRFVEWLKSIVRNAAENFGSTVYIDPTQLKNLTLQELSDLINAEDTRFDINVYKNDSFYNLEEKELQTAMSAYEIADQIDSEREQYINGVISKYQENNPNATQTDIANIKNKARIQFNTDKLAEINAKSGRNEVYDIIAVALSYEDLHQAQGIQPILDRINGNEDSVRHITEQDKDVFRQIKQGTKTRLRSQLSRVIKKTALIDELKKQLSIINDKNEDSIDDVFDTIEDFLIRAENEIGRTIKFIKVDLDKSNLQNWDPQQINYVRQDLIGYYEGLLKSVKSLFNQGSAVSEVNKIRMRDPMAIDLEETVNRLYENLINLQEDYQSTVVLPYAEKILVDFVNESDVIQDKPQFIKNMKTWLYQDTAYGDLAAGEVIIGLASRSRSSVVRIVEKMISDVEFERNRTVLKKGKELINLYNKIRPVGSQVSFANFQKTFIELDGEDGKSGMPTGYWLRDRNYGKFYKDKDEFEESLRNKYKSKGLDWTINDYSGQIELIFPQEDHKSDKSVFNQYYDELDEWLDKHCERRYKLEYYKKRRRFLSPEAINAQQYIQHQIDILCQKAMDEDGWVDSNKLDQSERAKLSELKKAKKELACPYIFNVNSDGIVTLEDKVGEEAKIADEISSWNEFIRDRVKYKQNKDKFNAALAKFPEGSNERKRFLWDNVITTINPELFKTIENQTPGSFNKYGEEYNNLRRRRRFIIKHITDKEGFRQPNLDLIGTGINQDTSVWEELGRIEKRMDEIRSEYYKNNSNAKNESQSQFVFMPVQSTKSEKDVYNYLLSLYMQHPGSIDKNMEKFNNLFKYTDSKGASKVLSVFDYLAPISETFKINPQDESESPKPSIITIYSSQFSELDESSDFVNEKWDKTLQSSLQPKIRKPNTSRKAGQIDYTNDQYNTVMSNDGYAKFYNLIISTMNEANSMIPARAIDRQYLMPQITARGLQAIGRSRSLLDIQTAVGYMFQDVFTSKFAEKDGDVSTNWDLPRRPDGTVVNNIPIRFIKRLEKPELISTDVVGSVMTYYDVAVNYSLKSKNLPSLELIKEAINPQRSSGAHMLPEQFKKVNNLLNYRYYGKEDIIGDDSTKAPSELNKTLTTFGKKFRSLASMSMLAVNFTTIEVGYIDAFLSSLADAIGGKYFTKSDFLYGYAQSVQHLPFIIANIGNPATSDWMIAAMQYNQLSRSNSEIFDRTDQSRFRKAANQVRMGGYTMADYLINTMILGAVYHHYRLVDLPDGGGKKFMSKSDAISMYTKLGYTEQKAIDIWEHSKQTLKQAYYVKDGVLTVKDQYSKYVTKKLENQIAGKLRDRTAVYNGVIPAVEKAKIQQNVWGSYLTLMRNFYVNTYWERAQAGYDVSSLEDIKSSKLGMRTADSAGYVNFETGEFGNGLWWSFLKGMYKYVQNVKNLILSKDMRQLTRDQRYAVKRILSEIVIIAISAKLMLLSMAFARSNDYDDDKDPTWSVNIFDPEGQDKGLIEVDTKNYDKKFTNWFRWKLALLATRTFTERSTFYWPGTATELLTSPSTAKAYLDDLGYNLDLLMDVFEVNGHNRSDLVKSGGYAGMSRGTRDVLKITGFTGIDNVVRGWHTSGIKSTLNWYQGVSPNNFIVPSKSVWLEQQGLSRKGNKKSQGSRLQY